MKVISFYMNEASERGSETLAKSCAKWGFRHEFESVPDHGSYQANRQHVPSWILWKLLDDSSENVAWINPTGLMVQEPVLLKDPEVDIAVFKCGDAFWAKTLYCRNSDRTRETLRRWANLNLEYSDRVSCYNFTQAINEIKPMLLILPPTYSWLPDSFPKQYGEQKPVISHPIGGL